MQSSTMVAVDDLMDILPRIGEPVREVEVRFFERIATQAGGGLAAIAGVSIG